MPNFDAGHYFLTVLAPVRVDSVMVEGQSHSHRHLLRDVLDKIPTGERTAASVGTTRPVPFAKNNRTHLARFAVLDQAVFNGRVSGDTLLDLVLNKFRPVTRRTAPLKPQWVDLLRSPFLLFAADFDATNGSDHELRTYLTGLWSDMSSELKDIFQHCYGFDGVTTADQFFQYVKKCQLETTMPFNDYWSVDPAFRDFSFTGYLIGMGLAALLVGVAGWYLFGSRTLAFILAVLAIAAVLFATWKSFKAKAEAPFPTSPAPAPGSDLPSVLKALYVQRSFTELAISVQGKSDQELYNEFAVFVATHRPDTIGAPTQPPGVIGV
jgi:hypothetical protein